MNGFNLILNYLESVSSFHLIIAIISYFLVTRGTESRDKPAHVILTILVFYIISAVEWRDVLPWSLISDLVRSPYWQNFELLSSILIPIALAVSWRTHLSKWIYGLLDRLGISDIEEPRTILSQITNDTSSFLTQIVIHLKSGKMLICDYTYDFREAPIEGYRVDKNGNIALYVTAIKDSENSPRKEVSDHIIINEDGSKQYRITYVAESEVSRVEFVCFPLRRNP